MKGYDTLGRATFNNQDRDYSITYTDRSLRWFEFLNLHGYANSEYLFQFTNDTHRSSKHTRIDCRRLVKGGYIDKPAQQDDKRSALYNYYVYNNSDRAIEALINNGVYEETIRPSGNFDHQCMIAATTGSLHIACRDSGFEYIPGHTILKRGGATLRAEVGGKALIPDQLCGIDYGEGVRFFMIEADRGTEQRWNTRSRRKTYERSIDEYIEFIGSGAYKQHYKVTSQMKVLYVFASRADEISFLSIIEKKHSKCHFILTKTIEGFYPTFKPLPPQTTLFTEPWHRANMTDFAIDRP